MAFKRNVLCSFLEKNEKKIRIKICKTRFIYLNEKDAHLSCNKIKEKGKKKKTCVRTLSPFV